MSKKVEPLTGMWADLKKKAGLSSKSPLWSSCEVELQELMRQIDIMVHNKKLEWERERQTLQARLEVREQEHLLQMSTLDQKHQEIGQLRQKLDTMERGQRNLVVEYEKQLRGLKDEVVKMQKEYEKLQKRYSKQNKEVQRDKLKVSGELEENQAEVKRLTAKVEELRQKSRDWEGQRKSYVKQIESLESQRKTLAEKCDLIQQQTIAYQTQVDKRKDMLDSTELSLRSRITQLESQLDRARDTVNSQDTQISRLKASLEDLMAAQRRSLEEKEKFEEQLLKSQNTLKKSEEEMNRLHLDLEAKVKLCQKLETTSQGLSQDLEQLEHTCREKDVVIQKQRNQKNHSSSEDGEDLLHDALKKNRLCREEIKKHKKAERQLREELLIYKEKMDMRDTEIMKIKEEMADKLQEKLNSAAECHEKEVNDLIQEVTTLKTDLQKRNLAIASLSERLASIELQLREQNETLERKNATIQVAHAQLDALRLENRHLRKTVLRQGDLDTAETERHLQELQNAYSASIKTLEVHNQRLQADLDSMRERLHLVDGQQNQIHAALRESDRVMQHVREEEQSSMFHQQLEEVKQNGAQQVAALQNKLRETSTQYEDRIKVLEAEVRQLEAQLESRNQAQQRLGLENEAMTSFVEGVEDIVSAPPKHNMAPSTSSGGLISSHSSSSDVMYSQSDDEYFESVDLVAAYFRAEQKRRTKELEEKLDKHIAGMKASTEDVLKKYNLSS